MKYFNKPIIAFMVLFFAAATGFCQSGNTANRLIGKWLFPDLDGDLLILTITENRITVQDIEDYLDDYNDEHMEIRLNSKSIFIKDGNNEEKLTDYEIQNNNVLVFINFEGSSGKITGHRIQNNRISSIGGKFINSNGVGLFESVEFLDRTNVRITGVSIGGFRSPPFAGKYEISGSNLIITASGDSIVFLILSDTIIIGSAGFTDDITVFIKQ